MDIKLIADEIENFKNIDKLSWHEVYEKVLDSAQIFDSAKRNTTLVKVVKEITHRGYSIEDNPFKLVKF